MLGGVSHPCTCSLANERDCNCLSVCMSVCHLAIAFPLSRYMQSIFLCKKWQKSQHASPTYSNFFYSLVLSPSYFFPTSNFCNMNMNSNTLHTYSLHTLHHGQGCGSIRPLLVSMREMEGISISMKMQLVRGIPSFTFICIFAH